MEFMQRGSRPSPQNHQTASDADNSFGAPAPSTRGSKKGSWMGLRLATVGLLFSATILILALVVYLFVGSPLNEGRFVNTGELQAVFLNGGQVYFGNIKTLNDKFMRVDNIYYLRVNQTVQPNQTTSTTPQDISLVKLGCELHGPTDEMLINRDQIIFWENLKTDGQVAKAVAQFKQQNPNGQNCNATSQSSSTPTSTTPATTTPSTTKK